MHGFFRHFATIALMSMAFASTGFAADSKPHHIAIQIDRTIRRS